MMIKCFRMKPCCFNNVYKFNKNKKFRVVDQPKDVSKLIFGEDGLCRIFEHKNGQSELKWIRRVSTLLTIMNTLLMAVELYTPTFGVWNQFSFSLCAGLGFFALSAMQIISKRSVHRIYLHNNLQNADVEFFNAFWKPEKVTFNINQFTEPRHSYAGFIRFEVATLGKLWIKLQKNQFRNVKDYEQTLNCLLLGKPLTNLNITQRKNSNI